MSRLAALGFGCKVVFLGSFYLLLCLLVLIAAPVIAATYEWTQATRWREDAPLNTAVYKKYPEQFFPYQGYDVRPHQEWRSMHPWLLVGDGNNKQSSDNLWREVTESGYVIGNSTNLTRARDVMEDFHINFVNPLNITRNFYFHFYSDNATSYVNRISFIAGRGTTVTIAAVRKDDVTQQCVPAFSSVTRALTLWTDYLDPGPVGRVASLAAEVNSTPVGISAGTAVPVSLPFDAQGETQVTLNYADAGQLRMNLLYSGTGVDAGLLMTGSDDFIARPQGLCVATGFACTGADASCPAAAVAGQPFNLSVTAVGWGGDGDSDFCSGNSALASYSATGLGLSATVLSPSPANHPGVISPVSYDHSPVAGGTRQVSMTESEVGVFRFDVTAPDYFGYPLGTYSALPAGRFIPDHFSGTALEMGEIRPFCNTAGAFTYSGQDMDWLVAPEFEITARNAAGGITENYTQSGFQRLADTGITVAAPLADSVATGTDSNALAFGADLQQGALSVSDNGTFSYVMSPLDAMRYQRSQVAEVAPFGPALSFRLTDVTDSDSVGLDSPVILTPGAPLSIKYGRVWVEDTYGPETQNLAVPLRTEYFDGSRYRLNEDDTDTGWDAAAASLSASGLTEIMTSAGTLSAGRSQGGILLRAPVLVPGTPDTGSVGVTFDAPSWLEGDYDNDGTDEDPEGTARFGVYRGHERIILWRERY